MILFKNFFLTKNVQFLYVTLKKSVLATSVIIKCQISFQVKSEGPKLVPFFKATCVYFVLWLPTSSPSWFSALIKCLPIFCLWVFLLAHGFSFLGAHSSARKILAGLIFSALGDAFLIWQEQGYFVHGEKNSCNIFLTEMIRGQSKHDSLPNSYLLLCKMFELLLCKQTSCLRGISDKKKS